MELHIVPASARVPRPAYAWLAAPSGVFTGVLAIPVGCVPGDPTGAAIGSAGLDRGHGLRQLMPSRGLPVLVNGVGMLVLAALIVPRHWSAPWLRRILGVGLIVWSSSSSW